MKYITSLTLVLISSFGFSQAATKCPVALAGITANNNVSISVDKLLKKPIVTTPGCAEYTITSFQLVVTIDGKTYNMRSYSDSLDSSMKDHIKEIKKDTQVTVEGVHYKSTNGETGELSSTIIMVSPNNK